MQETARYVSATHSNAPTEFHASIQTRLISPSSGTVEFAPENSDFTSGNSDSLPADSEGADFLCVKSGKWAESPAETSAPASRRSSFPHTHRAPWRLSFKDFFNPSCPAEIRS